MSIYAINHSHDQRQKMDKEQWGRLAELKRSDLLLKVKKWIRSEKLV